MRIKATMISFLLSMLLAGCTSNEDRARALHQQSLEAKGAGDPIRQESLLSQIVSDYPSTGTADQARKELEKIRFNREVLMSNTVSVMRIIIAGQALFLTANGRYARDLAELSASKRGGFDPGFLDPKKGYQYEMTAANGVYAVTARPAMPPLEKHFFTDNTGSIHEEIGKPATVESPITNY